MARREAQPKDLASIVARLAETVEKLAERVARECTRAGPVDLPGVWKAALSEARLSLADSLTPEQIVDEYPLSEHEVKAVVERAQEKKVKAPLEEEQLRALVLEYLGDNALKDRKAALKQAMVSPMPCLCGPGSGRQFAWPCSCGPGVAGHYAELACTPLEQFMQPQCLCGPGSRSGFLACTPLEQFMQPQCLCGPGSTSGFHEPEVCGGSFYFPRVWDSGMEWMVQNAARMRQR